MDTTRRTYSSEFKSEAVELAARSGRAVAEVERDLGLSEGLLEQWVRKAKRDGEAALPGHGRLKATDEEMRRLRREYDILRQESDILKSDSYLHAGAEAQYAFMEEERKEYAVTLLCRVLEASVSAYYAWRKLQPSRR